MPCLSRQYPLSLPLVFAISQASPEMYRLDITTLAGFQGPSTKTQFFLTSHKVLNFRQDLWVPMYTFLLFAWYFLLACMSFSHFSLAMHPSNKLNVTFFFNQSWLKYAPSEITPNLYLYALHIGPVCKFHLFYLWRVLKFWHLLMCYQILKFTSYPINL